MEDQDGTGRQAVPAGRKTPRPQCAVLIGLQGSGKTSFYRAALAKTHRHVSKDLLRSARNRELKQRELIAAALDEGASVAVDNTNPAPADRAPVIEIARAHGAEVVAYFLDEPIGACLRRNRAREGRARVPDAAIFARAKLLVPPVPEEGFDRVFRVRIAGDGQFTVEEPPPAGAAGTG